jgi:predicted regulator of amino acid metabolism with ACT domain
VIFLWKAIRSLFKDSPSKLRVARLLVEMGFRIGTNGQIYCDEIAIPATKIAETIDVDRRVVKETAKAILKTKELRGLFMKLKPAGPLLRDVAQFLGYGVIEIRAKPDAVGIIAEATTLIAKKDISIRQILAEDPEIYPDPKLILITEKPVPGELLPQFLKIPAVEKVTIS